MIAIEQYSDSSEEQGADLGREFVFPQGLPGFSHLRQFRLLTDPTYSPPFELLVSADDDEVGFYLVDPTLIDHDYAPDVAAAEIAGIQGSQEDEVLLRAIVTLGPDATTTTANLAAPILLNLATGEGCQAIVEDSRYSMRTPLVAPAN